MKKFKRSLLLSAAAVAALTLAIAGCGDDSANTPPPADPPANETPTTPTAPPQITESTDPSTVQSEQLTAEQWSAALASTNFTNVTVSMKMVATEGVEDTRVSFMEDRAYFYGAATYAGETEPFSVRERYQQKSGDQYTIYEKGSHLSDSLTADGWYYYASPYPAVSAEESFLPYITAISAAASSFTYDATASAYQAASLTIGEDELTSVQVKFTNGKISVLQYESEEGYSYTVLIYGYGSTAVTLPNATEFTGSMGGGGYDDVPALTQEEWEDVFDYTNYPNCSINAAVGEQGLFLRIDDGKIYQENSTKNDGVVARTYFAEDDGWYCYQAESNNKWVYATVPSLDYENFFFLIAEFSSRYDEFNHDGGGYYSAENFTYGTETYDWAQIEIDVENGYFKNCTLGYDDPQIAPDIIGVYLYGHTRVVLPKPGDNVNGDSMDDADEWAAAFDSANYNYHRINMRLSWFNEEGDYDDLGNSSLYVADDYALLSDYSSGQGVESSYRFVSGEWKMFYDNDGVWALKTPNPENEEIGPDYVYAIMQWFENSYSEFRYDDNNGTYTADDSFQVNGLITVTTASVEFSEGIVSRLNFNIEIGSNTYSYDFSTNAEDSAWEFPVEGEPVPNYD